VIEESVAIPGLLSRGLGTRNDSKSNMKNFKSSVFLLIVSLFVVSGCSINLKSDSSGSDGGVYYTENKGDTWQKKVLIPTTNGTPRSIASLSVSSLTIDPSDHKAIYYGSIENGLFYSYNQGTAWKHVSPLNKITISNVAVDPDSKCIIYTAIGNKLLKSTDCNRSWEQVYNDTSINVLVNTIAIDNYDSNILYIGTSRGEIIRSVDRGGNWETIGRFEDDVKEIVINPVNTKIIFVATLKKGIHRSMDGGANWVSLEENLKEFKQANRFKDIVILATDSREVFLANGYGILKTENNGESWKSINLITPETKTVINSLVVNPNNSEEIYYVTNTTFYRSLDGGKSWATKKLPTARAGWKLLADYENPDILYMGVMQFKK
jgi:photosystem II stability/assembly factor-like uncharacterized protein